MYIRVILAFAIIQLIFANTVTTSFKLDSSGWRTIVAESVEASKNESKSSEVEEAPQVVEKKNPKKLVEWDDDDLFNDLPDDARDLRLGSNSIETPKKNAFGAKIFEPEPNVRKVARERARSRLIYHGQVKESESLKVIDGMKVIIKTRKPVAISRRSSLDRNKLQPKKLLIWKPEIELVTTTEPSHLHEKKLELQELRSSSDWKPITFVPVPPKVRNKNKLEEKPELKNNASLFVSSEAQKWKPLTTQKWIFTEDNEQKKKKKQIGQTIKEDGAIVYGKKTFVSQRQSKINEPFDDEDGIIIARNSSNHFDDRMGQQREGKAIAKAESKPILGSNKWKPIETTTQGDNSFESLTTTETSIVTTTTANNSLSAETAHRSASDVNYIYSSNPETARQPTSASSYYSNYVVQPQIVPQQVAEQPSINLPPAIEQPIIDTTSGQTPEMIADRTPEQTNVIAPVSDYSMPQTSASFQPVQPMRTPNYAGYSYDAYNQQQPQPQQLAQSLPARQPVAPNPYGSNQQQQQQQPTRQAQPTSAPQVVRQEHHYHYYNQQTSQPPAQPERQLVQPSQAPIQNVIREIQPLLISQPIIQQASTTTTTTTTPAPPQQIIREIIKEVPVQTMQLQPIQLAARLMMPPPPPPPPQIPVQFVQPTREVDSSLSYALSAPAQRVIRQLTNSMPSVAVRLPAAVSQIRLPFQALQALPVRIAAASGTTGQSVTRQTGSFVIPPMPKKTTTYLTETQAMPTHTTIMHTTQFTPATRTTVYTTDHQSALPTVGASSGYRRR